MILSYLRRRKSIRWIIFDFLRRSALGKLKISPLGHSLPLQVREGKRLPLRMRVLRRCFFLSARANFYPRKIETPRQRARRMAALPETYPGKFTFSRWIFPFAQTPPFHFHHFLTIHELPFVNLLCLDPVHIGVIGGTGLRELPGFTQVAILPVTTPWGNPSSPITVLHHRCSTTGKVVPIAFLSRHGLHHELAPHEVPSRANIAALRSIGVRSIIAFSAVGSLQEQIKPRDFVVPDQVIDRTKGVRPWTFFEGGAVAHVGFADPFDEGLAKIVRACGHSLEGEGVVLHDRGTLVCMGTCQFLFVF